VRPCYPRRIWLGRKEEQRKEQARLEEERKAAEIKIAAEKKANEIKALKLESATAQRESQYAVGRLAYGKRSLEDLRRQAGKVETDTKRVGLTRAYGEKITWNWGLSETLFEHKSRLETEIKKRIDDITREEENIAEDKRKVEVAEKKIQELESGV
jgi:hypothetical protein